MLFFKVFIFVLAMTKLKNRCTKIPSAMQTFLEASSKCENKNWLKVLNSDD